VGIVIVPPRGSVASVVAIGQTDSSVHPVSGHVKWVAPVVSGLFLAGLVSCGLMPCAGDHLDGDEGGFRTQ